MFHHFICSGGKTARRNLKAGYKRLRAHGKDPDKQPCVIDTGAGKNYRTVCCGMVPTLTAARCQSRAYWITSVPRCHGFCHIMWLWHVIDFSHFLQFVNDKFKNTIIDFQEHRRLTIAELARLQGFESNEIPFKAAATSLTARGRMIGNSMTVPVLQAAIKAVLSAAGVIWKIKIRSHFATSSVNIEAGKSKTIVSPLPFHDTHGYAKWNEVACRLFCNEKLHHMMMMIAWEKKHCLQAESQSMSMTVISSIIFPGSPLWSWPIMILHFSKHTCQSMIY